MSFVRWGLCLINTLYGFFNFVFVLIFVSYLTFFILYHVFQCKNQDIVVLLKGSKILSTTVTIEDVSGIMTFINFNISNSNLFSDLQKFMYFLHIFLTNKEKYVKKIRILYKICNILNVID